MPMPEQRSQRYVDTSKSSPTTMNSVEQFFRGGDSAKMSPTYSPTASHSPSSPYFERYKQNDPEEDPSLYQKKSVLSKVKEKAKKLRNSLSKRRQEDDSGTPSWGVSYDDAEEEEDPEYFGAPMYESELAPEAYKENARQNPRANPVISEKHVLHNTVTLGVELDNREKQQRDSVNKSMTPTPETKAETIAKKLMPVYAVESKTTRSLSSKIQAAVSTASSPAVDNVSSENSSSTAPLTSSAQSSVQNSSSSAGPVLTKSKSRKAATLSEYLRSAPRDDAKTVSPMQSSSPLSASLSGNNTSLKSGPVNDYLMSEQRDDAKTVSPMQNSSSLSASLSGNNRSLKSAPVNDYLMSEQRDDAKTVSPMQSSASLSASLSGNNRSLKSAPVNDYLMSEQRDDAKTVSSMQSSPALSASLSEKNTSLKSSSAKDYLTSELSDNAKTVSQPQATPEATSSMRTSSNAGVMDKMMGAVSSLLGNEESSKQDGVKNPTTSYSSETQQVEQEENQGRILQTN